MLPVVSTKRQWTILILGFVFVHGALMQIRGPILPILESTYHVSPGVLGLVGPAATSGVIVALLIGGFHAGAVDMRWLLIAATAIAGLASVAIAVAPTIAVLLVFLTIQGLGTGLFRAFDRPILGHMYPENRGRMFGYYTAVWAIGAATAPVLATVVVRQFSWRGLYLLFTVPLGLCAASLLYFSDPPHAGTEEALTRVELRHLLRRPPVVITICLVVLSGSIEGAIFTWFPYFAGTMGTTASANRLLTYFFLAYIPGRLLVGTLLEYFETIHFVLFLALCSLPALYFSTIDTSNITLGIIATGLFVSGMFPSLLAYGINQAPEYSGPLNSAATGASLGGVTIAPALLGLLASRYGIEIAMTLPLCVAVLLAGGTAFIILQDR